MISENFAGLGKKFLYRLTGNCTSPQFIITQESIERGDVEQVAWYTSVLPVWLQVEWYARFLHNISDDHHRRHALQLGATVGLDTHAITSAVVTNIRWAFESLKKFDRL